MSSVDCDQCGAHYHQWGDLQAEVATDTPVSARCARCGAEIHSEPSAASPPPEETTDAAEDEPAEREPAEREPIEHEPIEDAPRAEPTEATTEALSSESPPELSAHAPLPLAEAESNDFELEAVAESSGTLGFNDPPQEPEPRSAADIQLLSFELGADANTEVDLTPSSQVTTVPGRVSEIPIESRDFIDDSTEQGSFRRLERLEPTPPPPPRTVLREREVSNSVGTPTLAALVERKERTLERSESELFPDLEPRDRRPPDIRVDEHSGAPQLARRFSTGSMAPPARPARTDAPVARPSLAPTPRSSSLGTFALFGMLLAAAGVLFARFTGGDRPQESASLPSEPVLSGQQSQKPRAAAEPASDATPPTGGEPSPEHSALESTLSPDPPPQPVETAIAARPSLPGSQRATVDSQRAPSLAESAEADTKPPEAAPTPFDAKAAASALEKAAQRANSCRKPEDLSGEAVVVLTFAPSGRVTTANVSGKPFAGTETGGCIASTLRETRVPPFNGEFITVKKTVLIQ